MKPHWIGSLYNTLTRKIPVMHVVHCFHFLEMFYQIMPQVMSFLIHFLMENDIKKLIEKWENAIYNDGRD